MFQLTKEEFARLKSHSVISRWGGARRSTPYAFTEQGVAMLSSVLNSKRAIQVHIQIMRAFVRLRQMIETHKGLAVKLAELNGTTNVFQHWSVVPFTPSKRSASRGDPSTSLRVNAPPIVNLHLWAHLERKLEGQDEHLRTIFEAIKQLMAPLSVTPRRKIGFHQE